MDVSIIIVNYKTSKLVIEAIASIQRHSVGFSYEIIIVDNNSNDGSVEFFRKNLGENIKILSLDYNLGFGGANNIGLESAIGEYILFLNPDILLLNNAIGILLEFIKQNQNIGAVGGNLYNEKMKAAYSHSRLFPGIFLEVLPLLSKNYSTKIIKNIHHNFSGKPLMVKAISGANMMIKRSVLDMVGYFNSSFFMYYEDTELSWRIRKAGFKNYNVPEANFIHLEGGSFEFKETRVRLSFESRGKYYVLTRGKFYKTLFDMFYLLAINVNIIILQIFQRDSNYYRRLKKIFCEIDIDYNIFR